MRLLYVSHSFPPPGRPLDNLGGMQRVATELHRALRAHPDVQLSEALLQTSWRWTHLRTAPFLLRLLREVPRVVRRDGAEVVLFSSMVTAAVAPALRRRLGAAGPLLAAIPVGRDVTLPNSVYQRHLRRVLPALDVLLPISRATAAECLRRGAPATATHVVPCGADLARFPEVSDRADARRELLAALGERLPPHALLLLSVGRHQERKGFHWFVDEVLPRLPPEAIYLLAGEGPLTGRIRELVAERGLQPRVRLLGKVSEERLTQLYRGADLFVMPNVPVAGDIEGFGVVMLEAGLAGLPVLAAELEGIRDVIRPGENGWLLPSGDAAAFAEAILRLHRDRAALAAAARAARAYTARTFSWAQIVERYRAIFQEALAGRAAAAHSARRMA